MPNNATNNNTNRSEHLTFGSLAICGISTSFILLATGISCLVISILQIISNNNNNDGVDNNNDSVDNNNNNTNTNNNDGVDDNNNSSKPDCGSNGKPPLLNWVLGTGISFMIITVSFKFSFLRCLALSCVALLFRFASHSFVWLCVASILFALLCFP